jgi:hypothetical protein
MIEWDTLPRTAPLKLISTKNSGVPMGLAAFFNLEGPDIAAFFAATLLGYLAGGFVPGSWSIYVSILVAYHLFLVWLILSAEHKTGISLPLASTIVTHLACLAVIIPLGIGHRHIPFFGIFRYGIASLAIFERGWLFSGRGGGEPKPVEAPIAPIVMASTGDDFAEWQLYLAQQKPGSRKIGTSLQTEYEQWLLARAQSRTTAPPATTQER